MSLTLIIGCMFSGKTTELLRLVEREEAIGRKAVVINHYHDSERSGESLVKTHSGMSRRVEYQVPCLTLDLLDEISKKDVKVLAINEGQFFINLRVFTLKCIALGMDVIIAGLDSDYKREPFTEIISLVHEADKLVKTTALCSFCKDGTPGIHSIKISGNTNRIQVGGSDTYQPVCRKCYEKHNPVMV